ncbi:MAG: bacteriocin [Nostoc sp.]|uniref:bacteriocin n=1 Tax=Nostoc sp. TaxID=1180 RepID=UPI002FF738B2
MTNNKIADLETSLFEELSDAELMAVVGGFRIEVDGLLSAEKCVQQTLTCLGAKSLSGCVELITCE